MATTKPIGMTMKNDAEDCYCSIDELNRFISAAFIEIGMRNTDAEFMTSVIMASEISGHECHGLRRFPEYINRSRKGLCNPSARLTIEKDSGAIVVADGR